MNFDMSIGMFMSIDLNSDPTNDIQIRTIPDAPLLTVVSELQKIATSFTLKWCGKLLYDTTVDSKIFKNDTMGTILRQLANHAHIDLTEAKHAIIKGEFIANDSIKLIMFKLHL